MSERRQCATEGCITLLARDNPKRHCSVHQQFDMRVARLSREDPVEIDEPFEDRPEQKPVKAPPPPVPSPIAGEVMVLDPPSHFPALCPCGRKCASWRSMINHVRSAHGARIVWRERCSKCEKGTTRSDGLCSDCASRVGHRPRKSATRKDLPASMWERLREGASA